PPPHPRDLHSFPTRRSSDLRKHFVLPASAKGRYFTVEFDGAMSNAHVWLNGKELGERPYGYSSFAFDLTPYLNFDSENVLAVRLDRKSTRLNSSHLVISYAV